MRASLYRSKLVFLSGFYRSNLISSRFRFFTFPLHLLKNMRLLITFSSSSVVFVLKTVALIVNFHLLYIRFFTCVSFISHSIVSNPRYRHFFSSPENTKREKGKILVSFLPSHFYTGFLSRVNLNIRGLNSFLSFFLLQNQSFVGGACYDPHLWSSNEVLFSSLILLTASVLMRTFNQFSSYCKENWLRCISRHMY